MKEKDFIKCAKEFVNSIHEQEEFVSKLLVLELALSLFEDNKDMEKVILDKMFSLSKNKFNIFKMKVFDIIHKIAVNIKDEKKRNTVGYKYLSILKKELYESKEKDKIAQEIFSFFREFEFYKKGKIDLHIKKNIYQS